jgi:hypothetical protein
MLKNLLMEVKEKEASKNEKHKAEVIGLQNVIIDLKEKLKSQTARTESATREIKDLKEQLRKSMLKPPLRGSSVSIGSSNSSNGEEKENNALPIKKFYATSSGSASRKGPSVAASRRGVRNNTVGKSS